MGAAIDLAASDLAAGSAGVGFRERVRAREGTADLLVFRVGSELFALPLAAVLEAVEIETVHPVPGAAAGLLGLVDLRGRMLPLLSPLRALGAAPSRPAAMLVLRDGARCVGIAIDDVDDVYRAALAALGQPPAGDAADGVLLAIAYRGADIVGVLDAQPLLAALAAESRPPEAAA